MVLYDHHVRITRRRLLAAGAAGLGLAAAGAGGVRLIDAGLLPGQSPVNELLGRCDISVPAVPPAAGPIVDGAFPSVSRRTLVDYRLAYPPGFAPGSRLPVCLVLHGYGADARMAIEAGAYDRYLAAFVAAGGAPFALAACSGGGGYWHPHPNDDPLGMLLREFVPLLADKGLATDRIGVLGWSMGGYGSLLCALTEPGRFAAVAASAPAIWLSYDEARKVNAGAFDSASQWANYDLFARAREFAGVRVRIDCGEYDPFAPAVRALRARLPDPGVVHLAKGCHDSRFWRFTAPMQLRFLGDAIAH
nr:putative esterase [uncultured bacterium]